MAGVLLTGSTGQVGGALLHALMPHQALFGPVHAPVRATLDLGSSDSIRAAMRSLRPQVVVNSAAYTAVDRAESEAAVAHAINAEAVGVLGEEARALDATVIHFSTDYVFAGDLGRPFVEQDATGPLNVYGASKLAGEQALAASGAAAIVLRTSWVFDATGKNFLRTILRLAREREQVRVVDDQYGAPTSARSLAALVIHLLRQPGPRGQGLREHAGVYHATCAGETTWYGFAAEALRLARLREPQTRFAELVPCASAEFPTPARRPADSRLDCGKLARTFGYLLPKWRQAVAEVSSELAAERVEG